MFLYDGAQSIYDQAWIGKKRTFKSASFDLSGKVRTLTKNFRTTTQISKAAYSLFKNNESILDNVLCRFMKFNLTCIFLLIQTFI